MDTEYEYYLNNWYIEMDLMCTPKTKISLMYSMNFVGTLTSVTLAFLPDRIGRKKTVIYASALSLATQVVMLLVPNLLVRSICFFLLGISTMKNSLSYVWSSECVPLNRRSRAFTVINMVDCVPTIVTGIIYLLGSRNV